MSKLINKIGHLLEVEDTIDSSEITQAFAVPGDNHSIDLIHPKTGRGIYSGENLEQIRVRYPGAEIVNCEEWRAAKAALQDRDVSWHEVAEEKYDEMLNVLPPAIMRSGGFMVGEPSDHHAITGRPRYAAFRERDGKFWEASRPMTVPEFKSLVAHGAIINPKS